MISTEIHEMDFFADKAFEEKDEETLKEISQRCLEWSLQDKYNILEKAIISYHGATAGSDYMELNANKRETYDENEKDIELCLLLFRNCINFFKAFKKGNIETCSKEEHHYFTEYENRAITNFSILLNKIGRLIKSIDSIEEIVDKNFSMAIGNHATTIISYGLYDYDEGHTDYFYHYAYKQLKSLTKDPENEQAFYFWQGIIEDIEKRYDKSFLLEDYNFGKVDLGDDLEESYRKWCLERKLFLNTMNDVTLHPVAAYDELLNFKGSHGFLSSNGERRYIVWLCEHLACFKEYFWDCEEVLFILAQNETELHITNNSKGIWTGLFTVILSNTETPFLDRFKLLMYRLQNSTALNIGLILDAIKPAFNGIGSKIVPPKVIGGRIVPEEWRPASQQESDDLKLEAMKMFISNLNTIEDDR